MNYILISGAAGVGKTESAKMLKNHLLEYYPGVFLGSFAARLKEMALKMGWDGVKDAKGRKFLQDLGRIGRDYDEDMWARFLLQDTFGNAITIVDDWRFPNERVFLSNAARKVVLIRVTGRVGILNGDLAQDPSETSLPESDNLDYYDFIIHNDYDLEYLREEIQIVEEQILNEKYLSVQPQNA